MLLIIILMIIYDYTLKKFIEVNTLKKSKSLRQKYKSNLDVFGKSIILKPKNK